MTEIRLATTADAKEIADIYGRYVSTTAISFELEAPTESEIKERLGAILPFAPWLVCVRDRTIVGYAYASKHRERAAYQWCVDTGVYIREGYHRRGIGRALYTSLIACLKLQGFYAAHAGATLPNSGSVGLHESLGFQKIGVYPAVGYKLGAWHDVVWWQLPLRARVGAPEQPLSVAQAQSDPRWESAIAAGLSPTIL